MRLPCFLLRFRLRKGKGLRKGVRAVGCRVGVVGVFYSPQSLSISDNSTDCGIINLQGAQERAPMAFLLQPLRFLSGGMLASRVTGGQLAPERCKGNGDAIRYCTWTCTCPCNMYNDMDMDMSMDMDMCP